MNYFEKDLESEGKYFPSVWLRSVDSFGPSLPSWGYVVIGLLTSKNFKTIVTLEKANIIILFFFFETTLEAIPALSPKVNTAIFIHSFSSTYFDFIRKS